MNPSAGHQVIAAIALAACAGPLFASGLPTIAHHETHSRLGVEALAGDAAPVAGTPMTASTLVVDHSRALLTWDPAAATTETGTPRAFAGFASEAFTNPLTISPQRRTDAELLRYSAVIASPANQAIIDPEDAASRALNFDRFASDRPTLAFFIPSAGTGTLMASAMLLGAPRRRKA